jgi:predicted metal-dependent hydrolase
VPILTVGEIEIPYTLSRSRTAKSARLTVTPGKVEVVVPEAATDDQIAAVMHRRREWLVSEMRRLSEKIHATPAVAHFTSGAKIPFRGRLMRLRVEPGDGTLAKVTYRNGFIVGLPRDTDPASSDWLVESALRLWMRKRLRQDVAEFVARHGVPNGLKPKAVRIKDQKHLWGSCGEDRIVNLNWQLIFAPKPVLEYAVVHELCHLQHRTHDDPFWRLVGKILPDWESRKAWLDRNEHLLQLRRVKPEAEAP